jgi:hypothetical protein
MTGVSLNWVALGFGIGTLVLALLEVIWWRLSKKEELERVNGRWFE